MTKEKYISSGKRKQYTQQGIFKKKIYLTIDEVYIREKVL
jgi:hypothetical protein